MRTPTTMPSLLPRRRDVHLAATRVAALVALVATAAPAQRAAGSGTVAGTVTDEANRPLEGIAVVADDGQRVATDLAGRFTLKAPTCDALRLTVRRPGALGVSRLVEPCAPGADALAIVLRPVPQRLGDVAVRGEVSGVVGVVTDRAGRPIAGAEVALLGARPPVVTDDSGRFTLLDVKPGAYLLRARTRDHVLQQLSVGLQRGDVREVQFLLAPLPPDASASRRATLSGHGIDAWWYTDLARRRAWGGAYSAVASREELLATGERDVGCAAAALPQVRRIFLRLNSAECANWSPPPGCVVLDGRWDYALPLWRIRAREVELLELYAAGAELSGNLVPRARCPRGQVLAVVWTH